MMMCLVLVIIVICLIVVLRLRSHGGPTIEQNSHQHEIPLASTLVDMDAEEEYLIAIITAAVHEFTGTGEFEVVRIKRSAENWTLIGRQNLLANR